MGSLLRYQISESELVFVFSSELDGCDVLPDAGLRYNQKEFWRLAIFPTISRTVRMLRSVGVISRRQPLLRLFARSQSSNALTKTALPFTYSSSGPISVKYTAQHEWIAAHSDGIAFVGITKYAADALGDATYIELPETEMELEKGDSLGSVESVKSASEIYQPASGMVQEANGALEEAPQLINQDPMGAAWIAKVKLNDLKDLEFEDLLDLEQYAKSLSHDDH